MSEPLFDVIDQVADRVLEARHIVLCLDFDGTLAPAVDNPVEAGLSPQMQRALLALVGCDRLALVVLSSRTRADLQERVGIADLIYAGNHGLEISGPGRLFVESAAAGQSEVLRDLATDLRQRLQPIAEARVEDKGLTLSVRFPQTEPFVDEAVRQLIQAALARQPERFDVIARAHGYEVLPRVGWHKGAAVGWIVAQLGRPDALVIYFGDDATDEEAFTALADGITVKVGDSGETASHFHVDSSLEVRHFLEWLADTLRHECLPPAQALLVSAAV